MVALVTLLATLSEPAAAYPEYQAWSQKTSGRFVNCGMCHAHPDGPVGLKPGQLGSLNAAQQLALGEARKAFEPGSKVNSPILNGFGNSVIQQLGRRQVIALRRTPAVLASLLRDTTDLDDDGLPDVREFREGTDPLDPQSGNPWGLFTTNFQRNRFHLAMIALATACGLFGLNNLLAALHGLAARAGRAAPRE